jgi:hypothetical protein
MHNQIMNICNNNEPDLSYNKYDELIKIVNPYEYIFSKVPGSKFSVINENQKPIYFMIF